MATKTVTGLRKPATLDHLRKKEPVEKKVTIILSDGPLEAVDAARNRLLTAENDKERAQAQKELDAATADLDEHIVEMRFRSIGRPAYDALISEHPPTEEQKKKAGEGNLFYNGDTFPIALIAASCVEPKMTEEEAAELFSDWNGAEVSELFFAALAAQTSRRTTPLESGSGQMNG